MRKMFTLFCLFVSLEGFTQIIYVNKNATGANDGTSWINAYTNLQPALTASSSGQIWVAAGTYFPGTDPTNSFILKNGVALYGGFNGSETILSQRNFSVNETILSGDIDGIAGYGGNSYHVVQSSGVNNTAVLDGFTITLGGNSGVANIMGGGMYNIAGAVPVVTNCRFTANEVFLSGAYGGAMYNNASSPVITNTSFSGNSARISGGAMTNDNNSSPHLTNCSFTGNDLGSLGAGGAIYNTSTSSIVLDNCFFSRNRATDGGAVYAGSSATFTNCSFEANRGTNGGAVYTAFSYTGSSATFTNCSFLRDTAANGGAVYNISSAVFTNCIFFRNVGGSGGGFYNQGAITLKSCSFSQNSSGIAGGAIVNILTVPSTSILTNCILWGDVGHPGLAGTLWEINGHGTINYSIVQYGHAGTGNLNTDPLFVRAGKDDLRLSSCSPAIDAGTSTNVPGFDIAGNIRPYGIGFDMGAYEYSGETFLFYRDQDNDGFGDPNVSTPACPASAGYVRDNTDCDDQHATVYPGAQEISDGLDNDCDGQTDEGVQSTFYLDADGDGYGDPDVSTTTFPAPPGYVTNNTDCDDNNILINPATVWYKDADQDGYGDPTISTQACTAPDGYIADNTDCDDTRSSVHPGATEICDGLDNNCDGQTDEGVKTTFYRDADADGYGDPTISTQACATPDGYVANNTDCNDGNAIVYPGAPEICDGLDNNCDEQTDEGVKKIFYRDADNDGYGNPGISTQACTAPDGYIADNTDCDDTRSSVHPGAAEICDGLDNNCDGQTDEVVKTTFYRDADSDGYGNPLVTTQACSAPAGYVSNNTDCDDTGTSVNPGATEICDGLDNNCNGQIDEGLKITLYRDADGDGYGNPSVSIQACTVQAGYVNNNNDCRDNDPAISPAAVEVCGNKIDDNCNGIVDEKPCYPCLNGTNFTTTNITSTSVQLNWSAVANPAQWQLQYKTTGPGSKWIDVFLTGDSRSVKITNLKPKQEYNWHIRAQCSGNWTSYSDALSFKTTASSMVTNSLQKASSATQEISKTIQENSALQLYPNPAKGQFMLELRLAESVHANATIQLIDALGRTVYAEKAFISNGVLQKSVTLSSSLTKGIYMVRIVTDDKTYKTRLLYRE